MRGAAVRTVRKKRKTMHTPHTAKLDPTLPESEMYTKLVEFERTLDATVLRKRIELEESIRKPAQRKEKLRIWIYSTTAAGSDGSPMSLLRIVGKLMPPTAIPNERERAEYLSTSKKFTSLLKSACIHFSGEGEDVLVEWQRGASATETDGIEVEQQAGSGASVRIQLSLDSSPARFKASDSLSKILDMENGQFETRPRILEKLWHYIKVHQLQAETRTKVNNNEQLRELFGCETIDVSSLLKHMDEHLSPPDPIEISTRLGGRDQCYDVEVEMSQCVDLVGDANAFLGSRNVLLKQQIESIDGQIISLISQIKDHRTKRQFYLCLHHSPVEFLNDLIASQVRDHQTQTGGDHRASEEKQTARFREKWANGSLKEATERYLGIKAINQQ